RRSPIARSARTRLALLEDDGDALRELDALLRDSRVEGCLAYVVGPVLHDVLRPYHPAGDHRVELGQEKPTQLVQRSSFGERAAARRVGASSGEVLLVLLEHPRTRGFDVGNDVGL